VNFDTSIIYLSIFITLLLMFGLLIYLRPPLWRLLSGVELLGVVCVVMDCLVPQTIEDFAIMGGFWLAIATVSCTGSILLMSRRQRMETAIATPPFATPQLKALIAAFAAVLARILLVPFLPFSSR
jgi:hypothetical protein